MFGAMNCYQLLQASHPQIRLYVGSWRHTLAPPGVPVHPYVGEAQCLGWRDIVIQALSHMENFVTGYFQFREAFKSEMKIF